MRCWIISILVVLAGASYVQCHQSSDSNKVSYEGQKGEIIQGEYKLNKRWSASVTRDENGGFAVDGKYRKRY